MLKNLKERVVEGRGEKEVHGGRATALVVEHELNVLAVGEIGEELLDKVLQRVAARAGGAWDATARGTGGEHLLKERHGGSVQELKRSGCKGCEESGERTSSREGFAPPEAACSSLKEGLRREGDWEEVTLRPSSLR